MTGAFRSRFEYKKQAFIGGGGERTRETGLSQKRYEGKPASAAEDDTAIATATAAAAITTPPGHTST